MGNRRTIIMVNTMRYKTLLFLLVIFFGIVPKVSAHVLKIDGSIGVTVHIDPDDAPIAKRENIIFVTIKDADKKFDENNPISCDCVLSIVKDGKALATLPITSNGAYNTLRYSFPSSGTYQLRIVGKPNGKGTAFQPFDTQVEYYVKSSTPLFDRQNPLLVYFPYLTLLAGVIILFLFLNPFAKRL